MIFSCKKKNALKKRRRKYKTLKNSHKANFNQHIKKAKEFNQKLAPVREREERERIKRERDLLSKFRKAEEKRKQAKKLKEVQEKHHQKKIYDRDQKNYFAQRNLSATRQKEEEDEILRRLEKYERNMEKHDKKKEDFIKNK